METASCRRARAPSQAGRDQRKDQSYFLFSLRQDQLARAMFPLGEKTKSDTREVARHCQLKTADKEESMEICFVPDNDYGKFLQDANLVHKHKGEIVDLRAGSWATRRNRVLHYRPAQGFGRFPRRRHSM